jgi:hypothetical protein
MVTVLSGFLPVTGISGRRLAVVFLVASAGLGVLGTEASVVLLSAASTCPLMQRA